MLFHPGVEFYVDGNDSTPGMPEQIIDTEFV